MKNRFTELYVCSLAILLMGLLKIIFNYTKANTAEEFYSGTIMLFVGAVFLVFVIISHIKYKNNRKQLEREMSKDYDERDDLIEGKAALFTMRFLMIVIFLMMFLSKWIAIPANTALFMLIILCMITNMVAKKYYNYSL
ncbi:hypothetical protein SAMN05661091_1766 [Paenibacillus uliginis N3/975]|uniref:DUF2178 domain-containing protein n=1 Tax=Paenibacillus uliginis N3/975 TaxID=1313296 RepID=A0A1X7H4Q3_9BACL|nr:hypothetical protein [Paenibacillus uliginis]SMF79855.1 hypothetical protein SAMN05661091_1766 [Paenibacillus uliginis N3/975]